MRSEIQYNSRGVLWAANGGARRVSDFTDTSMREQPRQRYQALDPRKLASISAFHASLYVAWSVSRRSFACMMRVRPSSLTSLARHHPCVCVCVCRTRWEEAQRRARRTRRRSRWTTTTSTTEGDFVGRRPGCQQ